MNSELTLFQEFNTEENPTVTYMLQLKCYQGLSEEVVEELEGYVAKAKRIVTKVSFDLAEILCNGRDLYRHNKHGGFEGWIEERFKLSRQTAYRIIWRYEQFGNVENLEQLDIALTAQYALSQPATPQEARDEAIRRAEEGEKITVKVSDEIIDKYKAKIKELEDQLEADREAHSLFKDEVKTNEQAHTILVQSLEQKLEEKPEPEKITVYQDTLETAAKVASLEQQIKVLEAKPDISPEKQKELDNLQQELKNAKTELDFYTTQNQALAEKNKQLSEESRRTFVENFASVGVLRIRQEWQYATTEVQASLRKFHTKVPSEIDRESFEGEEHTRTYQTIEVLEQTIAFLRGILPQSASSIVDEPEAPIAFIEASKPRQPATAFSDTWESLGGSIKPETYWELFEQYREFVKTLESDTLWWKAPDSGIMDMEMSKDDHIQYTRQLLKNGEEMNEPYRVGCAVECMKRVLAFLS